MDLDRATELGYDGRRLARQTPFTRQRDLGRRERQFTKRDRHHHCPAPGRVDDGVAPGGRRRRMARPRQQPREQSSKRWDRVDQPDQQFGQHVSAAWDRHLQAQCPRRELLPVNVPECSPTSSLHVYARDRKRECLYHRHGSSVPSRSRADPTVSVGLMVSTSVMSGREGRLRSRQGAHHGAHRAPG
jgi:hypothetical protein